MFVFIAALALAALPETITVDVDGTPRTAIIVAPSGEGLHPVIFGFHGHGGTARYAARKFDLQSAWPDAIAVYPEGVPTVSHFDPSGGKNGWNIRPSEDNPDIRFFDKLYNLVIQKCAGDPKRVFAMGHSNGGAFMYTLWITRSSKLAGLGSFEGAGAKMGNLVPKPFFITIGDKDQVVSPSLQVQSLEVAKTADGSTGTGTAYGPRGTLFNGKEPLVFWSYPGTHVFPADAVPTMIKFFQEVASKL